MHRMGGVGCSQAPTPPSLSQAACPAMGHPPDLPMGWDQGWACQYCLQPVCAQGHHGRGWHCGDPQPGCTPPVALSLLGGHTQGCCQARGQHREMGASMLLAPAGGSDGTRHKHLEHTCVHVCVPHRHSMGTNVAYVGTHICTVRRGCAGSELGCSPPCTPPPCGPTGVCGCPSGWPGIAYKAGHSHRQRGHSPMLLPAPQWGRRLGEYLSLAGG